MKLIPHPHAALMREWTDHVASGKVDAGWYFLEEKQYGGWVRVTHPSFNIFRSYRLGRTDKHPDYKPPEKLVKLEFEIKESVAEGFVTACNVAGLSSHKEYVVVFDAIAQALEKAK